MSVTTQHTRDAVTDINWNYLIGICMRCLVDPPTQKDLLFSPSNSCRKPHEACVHSRGAGEKLHV